MKNSNDTIGYRTRDLPACSAVPQPTAHLSTTTQEPKLSIVGVVSTSYIHSSPTFLWELTKFYVRVASYVQHSHQILSKSVSYFRSLSAPAHARTHEGEATVLPLLQNVTTLKIGNRTNFRDANL